MNSYSGGMVDVQEIVLRTGRKSITIDAGVLEVITPVPHPLKLTPFCEYKISFDGGATFINPHFGHASANDRGRVVNAYTDASNVYFAYGTGLGGLPAITLVVEYILTVTETS